MCKQEGDPADSARCRRAELLDSGTVEHRTQHNHHQEALDWVDGPGQRQSLRLARQHQRHLCELAVQTAGERRLHSMRHDGGRFSVEGRSVGR